jgi:AbrB family looped-hinge helix DNA binding protein
MHMAEDVDFGISKVTSTGSIVIPSGIRKKEGIKAGDKVAIVAVGDKIVIQKPNPQPYKEAVRALQKIGKL